MRHYLLALSLAAAVAACGDNLPGDQPPTAQDATVTTAEDTAVEFTVTASDPEGAGLTFTSTQPSHGTIAVAGDRLTYTPEADFHGSDSVVVTVADASFSVTATVSITVTPVNDAPVAVDDAIAAAEDTPATVTAAALLANDTDVDGDTLTITTVAGATHGTVALAGDTVTFTPDANFGGAATFTYTMTDGTATDTATVSVTVGGANDPPVATDDALTTAEDTLGVVTTATLLANDTDADGQTLSVSAVGAATHGTVTLVGGEARFQPEANYHGPASFEYTVTDGADSDTGLVTVTVTSVNDGPVATDDTGTTAEDAPLAITTASLLTNDVDVDGDTLTFLSLAAAQNGTLALSAGTITFTPAANFNGTAGFDYTISDGVLTDVGHVTINVTPANDAPVAVDDTATTAEDTAATITAATLLTNDTDLDAGATLTVTAVSAATNGTVALAGTTITFTPTANFTGAAGFDYTVSDGTLTDVGHVTVTVTPVNDAPVAVDDTRTINEDAVTTITAASLTANDTDVDTGTTFTVTAVSGATNGTVALAGTTITFTPTANFNGTAGFDYTVSDGTLTDVGHVTITVNPVNDPPVAGADTATTAEDTAATIAAATLLANDTDLEGATLSITAVGGATNGTVALAGTTITFTPAANFNGTATFTYTLSDGTATATGTVTVTVTPVNDAPVANADTVTTAEDTAATIAAATLLANDTDVDTGTTLTVTAVSAATNGTVALAGTTITFTPTANFNGAAGFDYTITDGALTASAHVTVTVTAVNDAPVADDETGSTSRDVAITFTDAVLLAGDTDVDGDTLTVAAVGDAVNGTVSRAAGVTTFTPAAGFSGVASFTYTVSDGALTDIGAVTISVDSTNTPPVATDDTATTAEDTGLGVTAATLLANDVDPDPDVLSVTAVGNPVHGSVILALGLVTFTPDPNYNGPASFEYTVSDGFATDVGLVTVTVTSVNDAPVAVADSATTDEDTGLALTEATLVANDTDLDGDALNVTGVSNATNGSVLLVLGVATFTPAANFSGTAGFDYTITDGSATATAHVTVTVNPVDDQPVAVDDNAFTTEDLGVFIDVLTNDTGLGDGGVSITATTAAAHGTVTPGATNVLYIPEANYNGTDTFTYTITDADGDTATGTVNVTMGAVADPPVANSQTVNTNQGAPVTITLTATDVDSPSVTFAIGTAPTGGTLGAITPINGFSASVIYTPTGAFSGPDSFTFTANDGALTSAAATVGITVNLVLPTVASTTPADAATAVTPLTTIAVTFSQAMNTATLTTQTASGPCTGSIQVSVNDFASCLGFAAATPTMSAGDTVATATPAPALANGTGGYKIRVTTAVQSTFGNALAATFTQATGFTTAADARCGTGLIISQVYGGGGNSGAQFNNDFIELHNPTPAPITMTGHAIQFVSATGTGWAVQTLPTVTIAPGGYYLIQEAAGAAAPAPLPTPDLIPASPFTMGATSGKVALTNTTTALSGACPTSTAIVDLVGFGTTANCFEGTGPTPAPSNSTSVQRRRSGCTDANQNATDFVAAAPVPRNSVAANDLVCACSMNESGLGIEADFCNLQFPPTTSATAGSLTEMLYARVFEAGVTPPAGGDPQVRSQFGFGPRSVNPQNQAGYTWVNGTFNVQVGNDDEYQAQFTAPAAGTYGFTSRFSLDGVNWTYCDLNGAGGNAGLSFDPNNLGTLTSN
ncbi:MAG: tandem-95 repeat protein [Myxococcales bacterium]|nr:tandem-95 repeat protein [Myxococcales bacterium]